MPHLPPGPVSAVESFAASIGIPAAPDGDGCYSFDFEESGRLSVLASHDGEHVLVSLSRPILLGDLIGTGAALAAGGYDAASGMFLHAGLTRDGRPVLALDAPARGFDFPMLDGAFGTLRAAFAEVGL